MPYIGENEETKNHSSNGFDVVTKLKTNIRNGIRINDPRDVAAISAAISLPTTSYDQCIARVRDDKLLGGVLYTGYTGVSMEMHVAGFDPHWINRDILWAAFSYPFTQVGVTKVIGRVSSGNKHTLNFDLKLGFKLEAVVRHVYPDGDLLLLSMYYDECRWLSLKPRNLIGISDGKKDESGATA